MSFIITTSTIVCIVGILFGTYAYLKESSAFSALLITFMCVGVTTLIFALAMYDPQEQEQQQKQLSKDQQKKRAIESISMIVSTNNEQLLPVSEQLKCFLAIKTALRNVTNGILPVCLEKKLLPKVLDLLELEMQHLSHRKKTEELLEAQCEILYLLIKSKEIQTEFLFQDGETARIILQRIFNITNQLLIHVPKCYLGHIDHHTLSPKSLTSQDTIVYHTFTNELLSLMMCWKVLLVNHSLAHEIFGEQNGMQLLLQYVIQPLVSSSSSTSSDMIPFSLSVQKIIKHTLISILILLTQHPLSHQEFISCQGMIKLITLLSSYYSFIQQHHHHSTSSSASPHYREILLSLLSIWYRFLSDHPHDQLDYLQQHYSFSLTEILLQLQQEFRPNHKQQLLQQQQLQPKDNSNNTVMIYTLTTKLLEHIGNVMGY